MQNSQTPAEQVAIAAGAGIGNILAPIAAQVFEKVIDYETQDTGEVATPNADLQRAFADGLRSDGSKKE